jgi:hypothetical protein
MRLERPDHAASLRPPQGPYSAHATSPHSKLAAGSRRTHHAPRGGQREAGEFSSRITNDPLASRTGVMEPEAANGSPLKISRKKSRRVPSTGLAMKAFRRRTGSLCEKWRACERRGDKKFRDVVAISGPYPGRRLPSQIGGGVDGGATGRASMRRRRGEHPALLVDLLQLGRDPAQ